MYRSKFANEDIDKLYEAILKLETVEDCYRFFEDLCTINEIMDMSLRLKVAKMLELKKPYQEITDKTKASTATVSRVNKSLIYGAEGYHLIFDRIHIEEE